MVGFGKTKVPAEDVAIANGVCVRPITQRVTA